MPTTGNSLLYDPLSLVVILGGLSMAPFVALMISSFVKIVIVTNLIRQALGLQQIPPNMVINGLAIVLSLYVMAPTIQKTIHLGLEAGEAFKLRTAIGHKDYVLDEKFKRFLAPEDENSFLSTVLTPLSTIPHIRSPAPPSSATKSLNETKALLSYAAEPLRDFLKKHSGAHQRAFFVKMAHRLWPKEFTKNLTEDNPMVLIPAFTISELTASFEIGFLIYLPFIVVDLVVSNILLAMGMMMVSPMTISLPFKLMLFVLVNGWSRLIESLLLTYR
jgi:type III secretion protein R